MSNVAFIFIHLGTEFFPDYVNTAIEQCRLWNPTNPIFFVSSHIHADKITKECTHISIEHLPLTHHHSEFINKNTLDTSFRHGFWRYTTERFFVLEEVCRYLNITEFFHVENDNMVYFNASELIHAFRNTVNGIASTSLTDIKLIFGFMYCNNIETLSDLTSYLVNTENNEMETGAKFFKLYNKNTQYLPSIPDIDNILSLEDKTRVTHNIETFNGVFDPAQYGQWLGGIDPRNDVSKAYTYSNPSAAIQPDQFTYSNRIEDSGLFRYYINKHGVSYPLYTLHIHSKKLAEFYSKSNKTWYGTIIHNNQEMDKYVYETYLSHIKNGTFIEAGAFDGVFQSNTKALEEFGWSGILVEPSIENFNKCKNNRPNTKIFNCALVSSMYSDHVISGDFQLNSPMSSINGNRLHNPSHTSVRARTLQSCLDESNLTHVDFLSLDVEGYELEVLNGIDWNKTRIYCLLIEFNPSKIDELRTFMESKNYTFVENVSKYSHETHPNWDGLHNDYLFIYSPNLNDKLAFVSFVNNGHHADALNIIKHHQPNADVFIFNTYAEIGCPPHETHPYGFKPYAVDFIRKKGYRFVFWIDSCVNLLKPIDALLPDVTTKGVFIQEDMWKCGEWANDKSLEYFGITRDEAMNIPSAYASFIGFDFRNDVSNILLQKWKQSCDDGIFSGSWVNDDSSESEDVRCKGHRHDQTSLEIISYQLNIPIGYYLCNKYDVEHHYCATPKVHISY